METKRFYQDEEYILEKRGEKVFLIRGTDEYEISNGGREPDLYIRTPDRKWWMVHNAFTAGELCRVAWMKDTCRMVTGQSYDIRGLIKLIMKAVELKMDQMDIGYVESRCFMDILAQQKAFSEETAFDLYSVGMENPNVMGNLIHAKKVMNTTSGKHYLLKAGAALYGVTLNDPPAPKKRPDMRLLSNNVRFGVGYRDLPSGRQYFAWHGQPSRNDDFITYAEITEAEFERINTEYPRQIDADRETAELFRNKYVDGHKVIKEGWNVSLNDGN